MIKRLVIFLLPSILLAQGSSTGVSHLKLPLTARNAATGEAFLAESGQLGSMSLNPATLLQTNRLGLLLSHTEWIQDVGSEYFAISYPAEFGVLALAISSTSTSEIEIRDRPGPALSTFTARSASLQASYATTISDIGIGVSAKFLYDKLYVEEATGYAFDVGVLYPLPIDGLTLGGSISNIGTMSAFVQQTTKLPFTARLGVSYITEYEDFDFIVGTQFVNEKQSSGSRVHLGGEANYQEVIALRLGYLSGYDSRSITGGLGLSFDWVRFDYAYIPFSFGIGTAHLFTLEFRI